MATPQASAATERICGQKPPFSLIGNRFSPYVSSPVPGFLSSQQKLGPPHHLIRQKNHYFFFAAAGAWLNALAGISCRLIPGPSHCMLREAPAPFPM